MNRKGSSEPAGDSCDRGPGTQWLSDPVPRRFWKQCGSGQRAWGLTTRGCGVAGRQAPSQAGALELEDQSSAPPGSRQGRKQHFSES